MCAERESLGRRSDLEGCDMTSTLGHGPHVEVSQQTLRDPVEIAALLGGTIEVLPVQPGTYYLESEVIQTPQLTVHWMSHHGEVVFEEDNHGSQVFGLLDDKHIDASVGGVDATPGAITATDPRPHVVRLRGRNDYVLMDVPEHWVLCPEGGLSNLRPTPHAYARLSRILGRMRNAPRTDAAAAQRFVAMSESVADALHDVVIDATSLGPIEDLDDANRIVREAVAAIREERAASITQLTREVAASRSSIYRSFDTIVGISPYAYMQQRRLTRLRRRLLEVDDEPGAVTREAANLGAYHLGNLAASYRKLFGELPSDTVTRSSPSINTDDSFELASRGTEASAQIGRPARAV